MSRLWVRVIGSGRGARESRDADGLEASRVDAKMEVFPMQTNRFPSRLRLAALALALGLFAASAAQAIPTKYYLLLEGSGGPISALSGTLTAGLTNQTEVLSYGQNFVIPVDPGDGSLGAFSLRPFKIVKAVDGSSPRLAQAMAAQETMSSCTLTLYDLAGGTPTALYRLDFTDAQIVSITSGGAGSAAGGASETVGLVYKSVEITDIIAGTSATVP